MTPAQELTAAADVLVVGAGLAGLALAGDVGRAGLRVRLADKGRNGPGGRCATRRFKDGAFADHGAQYFTARSERLQALAAEWTQAGWLRAWSHGFPLWDGAIQERPAGHPRFAPPAGMNDLPRHLAAGLDIQTNAKVVSLRRSSDDQTWLATTETGEMFAGRRVVLNLPPAQIVPLVRDFVDTAPLEAVRFWPAWALIIRLERDVDGATWPALEAKHPVLYWLSRDHTKRTDPATAPPVLVAHAQGPWSEQHLEDDPETVKNALLAAAEEIAGQKLAVRDAVPFRWRYSQPVEPYPAKHFYDSHLALGWCGDWCGGPKVEGALTSGWSLAEAILGGAGK